MQKNYVLLCRMRDQSQNIPADSKLRIGNGDANINKQVTIYVSNVFSTVIIMLVWNTLNK